MQHNYQVNTQQFNPNPYNNCPPNLNPQYNNQIYYPQNTVSLTENTNSIPFSERAGDLMDKTKFSFNLSKNSFFNTLAKLGLVYDDTPTTMREMISKIQETNVLFEKLAVLSKQIWVSMEAFVETKRIFGEWIYHTGVKEPEPIGVHYQEVGTLYKNLEYNEKMLLIHLSDTMRDLEFFRQNIIEDTLTTLKRAHATRLALKSGEEALASKLTSSNMAIQSKAQEQLAQLKSDNKNANELLETKMILFNEKRIQELTSKLIGLGKAWTLYHSNFSETWQIVEPVLPQDPTREFQQLMGMM